MKERGDYQLYAKKVEKSGIGDLFQAFEELKRKLEAEGLLNLQIRKISLTCQEKLA